MPGVLALALAAALTSLPPLPQRGLARETKGLLIGESANREVVAEIKRLVGSYREVERVNEVLTMHVGPEYILANISIDIACDVPRARAHAIMDELDVSGLSWKIYGGAPGSVGYGWAICPTFADCLYTSQDQNAVGGNRVLQDAANGALPAFSVVIPEPTTSQHNNYSMRQGDNWIGSVVSAIEQGPDWRSTAIFITYDDCGCFYDHVPPPSPDSGIREPMVIVSPFAKPGYTDSTNADFTSMLAYTEHTFGLSPLGANDAAAYPFTNAFDYGQAPLKPARLVHRPLPASAKRLRLTPALKNDPT